MLNLLDDNYFMKQALREAQVASEMGEVPVGAIVVAQNQVIGRGHNLTEKLHDVDRKSTRLNSSHSSVSRMPSSA